jgi:hypothetical protein
MRTLRIITVATPAWWPSTRASPLELGEADSAVRFDGVLAGESCFRPDPPPVTRVRCAARAAGAVVAGRNSSPASPGIVPPPLPRSSL